MKVLVLNAGSSTLKFLLMDMATKDAIAKGVVERINEGDNSAVIYKYGNEKKVVNKRIADHKEAMGEVIALMTDEVVGVIKEVSEISAFGHRVVHGVDYKESMLITDEVVRTLEENIDLAPLHNPAALMGIKACFAIAPSIPNVAVFDTAFHGQLPEHAFRYAIPKKDYEELKIRRYGFHGTSHYFITHEYAKLVGKDVKDVKIITCHLGNGSSVSAVKDGHSVDTSMGFTPLEGMVMGTRSGDIDPAVVEFLGKKRGMTVGETITYLNKKSGVLGLSNGLTSDMRELEENLDNEDAQLALKVLSYRLKKYIGSYFAALNGVEAIVFTGGVGENDNIVRGMALENMDALGIELDTELNDANIRGITRKISKESSKVAIYIIPTNEELVIAEQTQTLVSK